MHHQDSDNEAMDVSVEKLSLAFCKLIDKSEEMIEIGDDAFLSIPLMLVINNSEVSMSSNAKKSYENTLKLCNSLLELSSNNKFEIIVYTDTIGSIIPNECMDKLIKLGLCSVHKDDTIFAITSDYLATLQ